MQATECYFMQPLCNNTH